MVLRCGLMWLIVLEGVLTCAAAAPESRRESYLALAKESYRHCAETYPERVERWIREYDPQPVWGYTPPAEPVWLAGLAASLYDLTGEEAYAKEAVRWLAGQHRFKECFPESLRSQKPEYNDGVPTLTDFFHLSVFSEAYLRVKSSKAASAQQRARIEESIAESADYVLDFPEWGPMNRAMLRAEGLVLAAKALPSHPHAGTWRKMAKVLASDSWGRWEEEDAQIYHPVWLYSLIRYADAIGDDSLFDLTTTRYYFDYFLHLMAPTGTVPDFGDGRWNASRPVYLVCLERGGRQYGRGDLKWGAKRLLDSLKETSQRGLGARTGLVLTDAYRWAVDDNPAPQRPTAGSEEVLEDLVGKKIVFRSGWKPESTYLLLNYRDEGDYALVPRDYLRHTIPVEEETICLLMSGGSVLLHDAGYRNKMPSGAYGAFRADYFHNRLVGRKCKRGREQPLYEFLRHSGAYHPVKTQKIDFFTFDGVDVSRTRLEDGRSGFVHDRIIVYVREDNLFVVFDIVKVLEPDYYTLATLWHATTVLEQGPHYYVTAVDAIGTQELPRNQALLIDFVQRGIRTDATFPIRRHRQDEVAVYQTIASHYYAGQIETFVTVLAPHKRGEPVEPLLASIQPLAVEPDRAGVGVQIERGGEIKYICAKTDLTREILTENVRPRYTFASGRVQYGPIETDASFLYARRSGSKLTYSAANMVKILFEGREIFAARPSTYTLQPDSLSTGYGPGKWRYWEDTIEVPQQVE